jgi:hypothetical protein
VVSVAIMSGVRGRAGGDDDYCWLRPGSGETRISLEAEDGVDTLMRQSHLERL